MLIRYLPFISILFLYLIINLFNVFLVGLSYYDFGIYFIKFFNIISHPEIILFGHFQPIIFIIKIFYEVFDIYGVFIFNLLIFIISLFILFKIKNTNDVLIFFLVYPLVFICNFINFTPELIYIPIVFLFYYFFLNKKYLNSFYIIFLTVFIKEIYAYQLFFFGLLYLINKKYLLFLITSLLSFFSIFILNNIIETGLINNIGINNLLIENFKIFSLPNNLHIKLIFTFFCLWPIFFFWNNKNIFFLIPIVPYFIFVILTNNNSYYSIFSHYYIPIIPVIISYVIINYDKIRLKNIIILSVVINLFAIGYYFSINFNKNFTFKDYYTVNKFLNNNLTIDDKITISNKLSYPVLFKRKFLFSFPHNLKNQNNFQNYFIKNTYVSNIVILDLDQKLFIYDKVVSVNEFKSSDYYKKLINEYSLIYKLKQFEFYVAN